MKCLVALSVFLNHELELKQLIILSVQTGTPDVHHGE